MIVEVGVVVVVFIVDEGVLLYEVESLCEYFGENVGY